ncbi:hypothetical protein TREES_T100016278 [Tupaia chinensis]|uniref:Uncharacterized protein n=1 Tax=Tupaia chinensis TaxID=246437 RepID=L9JEC9_TUPCH|nr:hypothetical protein TREES_T100016278 [Tupaia chinensis]
MEARAGLHPICAACPPHTCPVLLRLLSLPFVLTDLIISLALPEPFWKWKAGKKKEEEKKKEKGVVSLQRVGPAMHYAVTIGLDVGTVQDTPGGRDEISCSDNGIFCSVSLLNTVLNTSKDPA